MLIGSAASGQLKVTLKGKTPASLNGQLGLAIAGKMMVKDTIENGTFSAKLELPEPGIVLLKLGNAAGTGFKTFYINSSNLEFEVNDSLSITLTNASKETRAFDTLSEKIEAAGRDRKEAVDVIYREYISAHTHAELSLFLLGQLLRSNPDYHLYRPYFEMLSERLRLSQKGQFTFQLLNSATSKQVGTKAKPFGAPTPDGKFLSLDEVLRDHKFVLVDFWASWCAPCRAENPNVVANYQAYKDSGFTVLSVSLDNDAASWKAAIVKDGMPWYHVSLLKRANDPIAALYGVKGIPSNLLIGSDGTILATDLHGEALSAKLAELIK